jgi:hypothetical protein
MSFDDLSFSVKRDLRFWANPNNIYHGEYQKSINRKFFVFLSTFYTILIGIEIYLTLGIWALISVGLSAVIALCGVIVVFVILRALINDALPHFTAWLNGK